MAEEQDRPGRSPGHDAIMIVPALMRIRWDFLTHSPELTHIGPHDCTNSDDSVGGNMIKIDGGRGTTLPISKFAET